MFVFVCVASAKAIIDSNMPRALLSRLASLPLDALHPPHPPDLLLLCLRLLFTRVACCALLVSSFTRVACATTVTEGEECRLVVIVVRWEVKLINLMASQVKSSNHVLFFNKKIYERNS